MLRIKDGITLYGLQSEMLWALDRANEVYDEYGKNCTVTSARGGNHSLKSRHFSGLAVDLRINDLVDVNAEDIASDIRNALGKSYDVVHERDHIHIEYDPKGATKYLTLLAA